MALLGGWKVSGVAAALIAAAVCSGCTAAPSQPTPLPAASAWRPTQPIQHQAMTEEEALELRDRELAKLAEMDQVKEPPKIALVRWTTVFDSAPAVAACLQEAGFNAVGFGTRLEYPDGITEAQMSAFGLADYECSAKYSLHPKFTQRWTEQQWGVMYDYTVEAVVPCLKQNFKANVAEAPTRDTYIAAGMAGNWTWDPYTSVAETLVNLDDRQRLEKTCPQNPPVDVMWG